MAYELAARGGRRPFHLRQGVAVLVSAVTLFVAGCAVQVWRSRTALEHTDSEAVLGWSPSVLGPATTKLIFVSNRTGTYHIYSKNLTSGRITMLTSGNYNDMNPQISPNRKELVFYSDRTGSNQIYTSSLQNPGKAAQLTHDTGGIENYDPVYMPDGAHILYKKTDVNGNYGDIWQMNVNGSEQHNVTPGLIARGIEGWKPTPISNTEVVFTERSYPKDPYSDNLYKLNVQTHAVMPLTSNGLTNWYPTYSPETGRLIFVTKEAQDGNDVVAVRSLTSSSLDVLVRMPGDNDDPSWSPNGKYAVFLNNNDGPYDIYAVSVSTGMVRLLDKSPAGSRNLSPILVY